MQTVFLVALASQYDDMQIEQILLGGLMGILGPILIVLLCLWLGRGERSPWYVKVILAVLVIILLLVMLCLI